MGTMVQSATFSRDDYRRYRRKVRQCLDVFAQMLDHFRFDEDRPVTGLEVEINLVDERGDPAMRNHEVLALLADVELEGVPAGGPAGLFQCELGRFNLELNVPPQLISGHGLGRYESYLRAALAAVDDRARQTGAGLVLVGILPTVMPEHAVLESISASPRFLLLNDQIVDARGGDVTIDIRGVERLYLQTDSILPEAANTSVQFHLQVTPATFPNYWNASQAIVAAQVAVGANSPFLFGRRLWDETRVPLFEQAADTRPEELKNQGVRPRVWFGERWITSIFDLFEENVRYFPALLPISEDEEPAEIIAAGGVPALRELRLHNGTIYRWNRPVYDVPTPAEPAHSPALESQPPVRPHLRVENRVVPAGPTVVDMLANAAFYFGLVRTFAEAERPVWSQLPFAVAEQNFYRACRHGLDATLYWPRCGEIRAVDLILERLLPTALDGLDRFGVAPAIRDRLLGIIERRCALGRNGATWQAATVAALQERGLDRRAALREMLSRYRELSGSEEPVHTWFGPG